MRASLEPLPILLQVLREPRRMAGLALAQWDLLLRQALAANLTASLACLAEDEGMLEALPAGPRRHLAWALVLFSRHADAVRWEAARIGAALAPLAAAPIMLKGAAYALAGLPPARGRLFSDLDLLVPRAALPDVESQLMKHGWMTQHHDA